MIIFFLQFLLTNIIFSVIICSALIQLNKEKIHSNFVLLLYSLGLAPALTSLLLYYFLLFSPHKSYLFYFMAVIVIYFILLSLGRKNLSVLFTVISSKIADAKKFFIDLSSPHQIKNIIFSSVLVLLLASFLFLHLSNTLQAPLDGTDALKYGTLGKIFFKEKSLEYRWIRPYPQNGFYLITNHAPSFALLMTWDKITTSFFSLDTDFYYKSLSIYYSLLILSVMLFWLFKKNKYLALVGVSALIFSFSFFQTSIIQHLDSYRIFFLIISWIFLAYSIEKKDRLSLYLLGIFSGLAAFSHTIGAIIVTFNCLALFIFMEGKLKSKLKKTTLVVFLVIIFGWLHYILDIFWGFGWIVFNREITYWG